MLIFVLMSIFGVTVFHRSPNSPEIDLPPGASLLVPVLSPAGGGCRSTVAGLLAATYARAARTVLCDASPPVLSPWGSWATPAAEGMSHPGHDSGTTPAELVASCRTQSVGPHRWQVLSLPQRASGAGAAPPDEWIRMSRLGGWAVTVVDTGHSALADVTSGPDPVWSTTAAWLADASSAPVLSLQNTAAGLDYAHRLVTAAEVIGIPCARVVVALVDTCAGPPSRAALRGATVLGGRVGAVVRMPFDPVIRGQGLIAPHQVSRSTRRASRALAAAVVETASSQARPAGAPPMNPRPIGARP
jgi:hypothetical protein